jgi:hypothetical protein
MSTVTIWLGAIPYVIMQLFVLGVVWAFPPTATWLPKALFQASRPSVTVPAGQPQGKERSPTGAFGTTGIKSGKAKFDEDGIPLEGDDPMGFSKRQSPKAKFNKDGIPIEDDDPMGLSKRK